MVIPEGLQFWAILLGIGVVVFLVNLPFAIMKARRERIAAENGKGGQRANNNSSY